MIIGLRASALLVLLLVGWSEIGSARRRGGDRDFPRDRNEGGGFGWAVEEEDSNADNNALKSADLPDTVATWPTTSTTTTMATTTTVKTTTKAASKAEEPVKKKRIKKKRKKKKPVPKGEEEDEATKLINNILDGNLTAIMEEESMSATSNKTIYIVDATYKAENLGLNTSELEQCILWNQFWNINQTVSIDNDNSTAEEAGAWKEISTKLKEKELINTPERVKEIGIVLEDVLDIWKGIEINYKKTCKYRERFYWIKNADQAKEIGIDEASEICSPFKEELNPGIVKLGELAARLNILIDTAQSSRPAPVKEEKKEEEGKAMIGETMGDDTSLGSKIPIVIEWTKEELEARRKEEEKAKAEKEEEKKEETTEQPTTADLLTTPKAANGESEEIEVVETMADEKRDKFLREKEATKAVDRIIPISASTLKDRKELETLDKVKDDHKDEEAANEILRGGEEAKDRADFYYDTEERVETTRAPKVDDKGNKIIDRDDPEYYYVDEDNNVRVLSKFRRDSPHRKRRAKRSTSGEGEAEEDYDEDFSFTKMIKEANGNETRLEYATFKIDPGSDANPVLYLSSEDAAYGLNISFPPHTFSNHEGIALILSGVCSGFVPKTISGFNESGFAMDGIQTEGFIGVSIPALEAAGVNLTELAEQMRNDTAVDNILSRTNETTRTLGGSYILPVLIKNQYDAYSAPLVFEGSAVMVRFGVYIESMSNFQTSTMDYDMDVYLLMAWRDPRLYNPYGKPILVKEEEVLEKIWRPDPFFANAKEAEFHEVTFLNFLMRIFPDGLVLYETRIRLKTACSLILCKYPHDKQTCELQIKSFAYPLETVRFEWFTKKENAIDKNPDVKLPELYIDRYEPTTCDKTRKSGSFACLRAVFRLKRDVGFHIAQTYIPTSLALMFSWVGVWLPEEFMEGRIGVAITVLLTLSTESAGAREHLPSVSYMKAIDLWFGFITGFVFFTLLQTLFVIAFDKRAAQLRKFAAKKRSDINEETREAILRKADRYHKTGRYLDNFCRVFYPLSFALFLIMYYFVYTEGRQDDCINRI